MILSYVGGTAWLITGSRSDDWIYWHCYYNYIKLQPLITAHNQWLPKAYSVSFLDYGRLLFHCGWLVNFLADWFFSGTNVILCRTNLDWINSWINSLFITFSEPCRSHLLQGFRYSRICGNRLFMYALSRKRFSFRVNQICCVAMDAYSCNAWDRVCLVVA
jgi:hypothetical protein